MAYHADDLTRFGGWSRGVERPAPLGDDVEWWEGLRGKGSDYALLKNALKTPVRPKGSIASEPLQHQRRMCG